MEDLKGVETLQRCSVKMPANEAVSLGQPLAPSTPAGGYTGIRVQVPKGNNKEMARLMQALKAATDQHNSGQLTHTAYKEACDKIQEEMDGLVHTWVSPTGPCSGGVGTCTVKVPVSH